MQNAEPDIACKTDTFGDDVNPCQAVLNAFIRSLMPFRHAGDATVPKDGMHGAFGAVKAVLGNAQSA
jgi:hypothetical protein